jgi:hypothetical protein
MVVPPGVQTGKLRIVDKLGNKTDKPLDLEPPPFSRVRMAPRTDNANPGRPLEVEVFVVKPDGTPDDQAKVEVTSDSGEMEYEKRIGTGVYLMTWRAGESKAGSVHLEAKANGQLSATDVLVGTGATRLGQPFWRSAMAVNRPWSVSIGAWGALGSSFDGANIGGGLLDVSMRLEILPLELVLEGGPFWYSEILQYGANATNSEKAKAQSAYAELGIRAGVQLYRNLDGHAALLFGAQSQVVDRTLPTMAKAHDSAWTPRVALALGINYRLGPGRILAQVQVDSSASGLAGLDGSLSGLQGMAGYLLTVY